jgi:sulfatase maturation enzyme AslB (radical SAM superfamily)
MNQIPLQILKERPHSSVNRTQIDLPKNPFRLSMIVMQPTPFCNLDCTYCYLANKDEKSNMPKEIASLVADFVTERDEEITIAWHGGEPLSAGLDTLEKLVTPLTQLSLITAEQTR